MGFHQTSVLCHSIEEQILAPEKILSHSLYKNLKLLKSYISEASDSDSFTHNSFCVSKLFEFSYLKAENFKLNLTPINIEIGNFLLLRKIFIELIKNSIAHSNLELKELEISINSKFSENIYEFYYSDNSRVMSLKKTSKVSVLSGRGVGLISIYDLIKNTPLSIENSGDYQYCIKLDLN